METVHQLLRVHALQFLFGKNLCIRIFRAVLGICTNALEVLALGQFGVLTGLQFIAYEVVISFGIYLCLGQQLFEQRHGLRHVFLQTGEADVGAFATRTDTETARHFIEGTLDVFRGHVLGSQIFQISGGQSQCLVLIIAHIKDIVEFEKVVGSVLLVEHFDTGLCLKNRHILLEIHEHRFDRFNHRGGHFVHEYAGCIAVHLDRCDHRLGNLLFVRVLSFTLVHHHIIVHAQILVGQRHHVFLGQLRQTVKQSHFIGPIGSVDE